MNTIVIGSLNTDFVARGIKHFPRSGEHVYGKELVIGPGGKSRNIADMIAHLAPANSVAMIGRTVSDPYGLWKPPIEALRKSSVNTDYITIADYDKAQKLPAIALIPVDDNGHNQIILLPGASNDFSIDDIDKAEQLFLEGRANDGLFVLTMECPYKTALYAVKLANKHGLKVMFDPGGLQHNADIGELINSGIYLIKPNEHEAKVLTGIEVQGFNSAKAAAVKLHEMGIENVLITVGPKGAYLFSANDEVHIPIPTIFGKNKEKDETGCGDQTMAAMCAYIQYGKSLNEAAQLAIRAGTLQFYRSGIQPLQLEDIRMP